MFESNGASCSAKDQKFQGTGYTLQNLINLFFIAAAQLQCSLHRTNNVKYGELLNCRHFVFGKKTGESGFYLCMHVTWLPIPVMVAVWSSLV